MEHAKDKFGRKGDVMITGTVNVTRSCGEFNEELLYKERQKCYEERIGKCRLGTASLCQAQLCNMTGCCYAPILTPFQYCATCDRSWGHLLSGALESASNSSGWLVFVERDPLLLGGSSKEGVHY